MRNQATSQTVISAIDALGTELEAEHLSLMFRRAFFYTLDNALEILDDGTVFVLTGDIPAMWLRDSSWQILPYLRYCNGDDFLRQIVRGVILRQAQCICLDPYANAFTRSSQGLFGFTEDVAEQRPGVWERKFEIDSLVCPLMLIRRYVDVTGDFTIYNEPVVSRAIHAILVTLTVEQRHHERSSYSFKRLLPKFPYHDTDLAHGTEYTGLIWSAFRPSDDGCVYNYHIPSQMFALVELSRLYESTDLGQDVSLCRGLIEELRMGIERHGIIDDVYAGNIYAYEVDGRGHYIVMDDANLPSLLGLPLLDYCGINDEVYLRTRNVLLSQQNPYYYTGKHASGIGSSHTPSPYVWPLSLAVEAMTCSDPLYARRLLRIIAETDAATGLVHESFHPDLPTQFTRPHFAWGNAMFAEAVHRVFQH